MKYQYYKPAALNQAKLIQYLEGINECRHFTNNGPLVNQLKEKLEAYLDIQNLLLVSSGTVALQLAYNALGLDGKIITTPLSFVATASAYKWLNKDVSFADIDPESLNLAPGNVENNFNLSSDDAVVATHLYGNPCDIAGFERLSQLYGNKTIYDASHAFDTCHNGRSILSEGDASVISFHATKLFHTIEGGGVVFSSQDDYLRAQKMINFGFDSHGDVVDVGINAKMSELHAAVGLTVFDDIESTLLKRREIAEKYQSCLASYDVIFPLQQKGTDRCSPSFMPLLLASAAERDLLCNILYARGIEARKYFEGLINKFPGFSHSVDYFPNASEVENRLLCLPFYVDLNLSDITYICERVIIALDEIRLNASPV